MTKSAIQGNYSDIKNVKTRSCVQIIIEVPIEHAAQIQAVLGWPQPGSEIPVAIARLHDGAADNHEVNEPTSNAAAAPSPRTIDDMPYPQQAALLCRQEPFQAWMERQRSNRVAGDKRWHFNPGDFVGTPEEREEQITAHFVRNLCDVKSRSELQTDSVAAGKWQQLYSAYKSEHPF